MNNSDPRYQFGPSAEQIIQNCQMSAKFRVREMQVLHEYEKSMQKDRNIKFIVYMLMFVSGVAMIAFLVLN